MTKNYYSIQKITSRITAIWSACGEVLYLIEGEERALLMDTNLGVGHLKALVDSLTDKPYDVVLTHGHIDHAPGAPEFPKVYMNHADLPIYRAMCGLEGRMGYLRGNLGPRYEEYQFEDADFIPPMPDMAFEDLKEGDCFDLGQVHVEVYALPGHTPGSMILLIPEERVLITGDACNDSTFLFDRNSLSVEEYRQQVIRIRDELQGRYDRIFICHHAIDTSPDMLDNMIDVCDDILNGCADDLPFEFMGTKACIAKKCSPRFEREDGKHGNLIYNKNKIRANQKN